MPAGPAKLMIIRHGEKPADPPVKPPPHGVDHEGRHSKHSLLPRGWQRAGALSSIFAKHPHEPLAVPDAVFAPDYGKKTRRHRTTQTVTPLAENLEVAVQTPIPKGEEGKLVDEILAHAEGNVLICWEHHHIPDLTTEFARAVGIDTDDLPSQCRFWPEDDFWTVVVFTRTGDDEYEVTTTSEAALEGDPPPHRHTGA